MKTGFVIVGLIVFIIGVIPTSGQASGDRLPAVFKSLKSIPGDSVVRVTFSETRAIGALSRDISSRGWILYIPGRGILRVVTEPFEKIRFISNDGNLVKKTRGGSIQRLDMDQLSGGRKYFMAFLLIMKGKLNQIDQFFQVNPSVSEEGWQLELTPKTSDTEDLFDRIRIQGRDAIRSVTVFQGQGNIIHTVYLDRSIRSRMTDRERTIFQSLTESK